MKIKLPETEEKQQQYYDELLEKIRKIRASEKSPRQKVEDIVKCAADYDSENGRILSAILYSKMSALGTNGDLRFANRMIMDAEDWAENHQPMTMKDINNLGRDWLKDANNNQHIYEYPSFRGISNEDEEVGENEFPEITITLPKELQGFKGGSMILKIEDMDRFVDTFCSRNTYYRRAYDILAELDKKILECLEDGEFPLWTDVEYKDWGFANFEFSHFEVDLREPDSQYRTLYVVYRYDCTAS